MALFDIWEAHRGGGWNEMPESCSASFEYVWMIGATPEADVNTTADGVLISLHDSALSRTSNDIGGGALYRRRTSRHSRRAVQYQHFYNPIMPEFFQKIKIH